MSRYIIQKQIDFTVMGWDAITSNFLNWCMEHRDNLEFMKDCKFMESESVMVGSHFDDLKVIKKIDKPISYKRS